MGSTKVNELINQDRRQLLGAAAIGIFAGGAVSLLTSQPAAAQAGEAIRPFRVNVSEADLVDLRRRIAATRWPDRETVNDRSQGAQLANFQDRKSVV